MPLHISVSIIFLALFAAAILSRGPAHADSLGKEPEKPEHETVLEQRLSQNILPFKDILKIVQPHIRGELIETEFEIEDDIPVYEFKYINQSGRVMEMIVDARTGEILKEETD